jgi:hypothetical protein
MNAALAIMSELLAGVTLPSERVAHKRTGFGLSSGWR